MSDWISREKENRQQGPYRVGTVVAVSDAEGLDVQVAGGIITGLQYLDSYSAPGIGDVVALLYSPGQYFVLGKFGTTGANLGPNLLTNPGFEFGVPGSAPSGWSPFWSLGSTGVEWLNDEAEAHSSGASARAEVTSLTTGSLRRLETIDAIPVESGATYRFGCWFRATTADANTIFRLTVVSGPTQDGAKFLGPGSVAFDVADTAATAVWTEVAGLRTIPAAHNYIRVYPSVLANAGHTTPYVFMDDVSFRRQL